MGTKISICPYCGQELGLMPFSETYSCIDREYTPQCIPYKTACCGTNITLSEYYDAKQVVKL